MNTFFKKTLLVSTLVFASAITFFVGSSEPSEFQADASTSTLWSIDGSSLSTNGSGTGKTHSSATYNFTKANGSTVSALSLDGSSLKMGNGQAQNKPSVVVFEFGGTGQPWTPSDKDMASISIYVAASKPSGTSIAVTFDTTNTASPTGTVAPFSLQLSKYTFAIPTGKENTSFKITVDYAASALYGWVSAIEVAYGLGRTPTALSVATPPTKTQYLPGESFNTAGMSITATFSTSPTTVTNYTEYGLIPPTGLCQSNNSMTIYALGDSNIKTSTPIAVTGGGFYAGLNQTRGLAGLSPKQVTYRVGETFDPTTIDVYGYLACLSTGGALQVERLNYDATGSLGFKIMNAAKTVNYTTSTVFSTAQTISAVASFTGTPGSNPDPEATLSFDGVSGVMGSISMDVTFNLVVLAADAEVTNTASTSSNTFSGATASAPSTSIIGGINWHLFLTNRPSLTAGVGFESSGSARGTSFLNSSSVRLISDPYNYYGDILVKSVTVTLSTASTTASVALKVGNSNASSTASVSSSTTNQTYTFSTFGDDFNLGSANRVGYGYGHITMDITGLSDTCYIKTITVDSYSLPNPRRAVSFGTILRVIDSCNVTLKEQTEMEEAYDALPAQAKDDYLAYTQLYDKTSLDQASGKFTATVTALNKYLFVQGATVVAALSSPSARIQPALLPQEDVSKWIIFITFTALVSIAIYYSKFNLI